MKKHRGKIAIYKQQKETQNRILSHPQKEPTPVTLLFWPPIFQQWKEISVA
jgi:hypothetical protein